MGKNLKTTPSLCRSTLSCSTLIVTVVYSRLYPVVTMNCRVLDEDRIIGGYKIPKKVNILLYYKVDIYCKIRKNLLRLIFEWKPLDGLLSKTLPQLSFLILRCFISFDFTILSLRCIITTFICKVKCTMCIFDPVMGTNIAYMHLPRVLQEPVLSASQLGQASNFLITWFINRWMRVQSCLRRKK